MFNLTSSVPKSWQTVSRQADRATADRDTERTGNEAAPVHPAAQNTVQPHTRHTQSRDLARDLGSVLRERREAMGASLAEVEAATRIRQKYLAALESDEWHLLPGEVVGRGFLRNYATYLGLDPTEVVERRRAVADPQLAAALYGTSAGSALPPERDVDYRPKDVSLKDEPEGIQQRELRVGPYLAVLTFTVVLLFVWWLASNFGPEISTSVSSILAAAQDRANELRNNSAAVATPDTPVAEENAAVPVASDSNATPDPAPQGGESNNAASESNANSQALPANPVAQNTPVQSTPTDAPRALILIPTDTPAAPPADTLAAVPVITETLAITSASAPEIPPTPTETPVPPTDTPAPVPTDTPTPVPTDTPPPVVAAFCADDRMAFFAPGVGQTLSGAVSITGRAVDPNIDYYKLEYAVGANAEGGYVYFDGSKGQVDGGILGTLNTGALPNGDYTLQLTVVDLTGNYPPPCRVSVVIQN